MSKAIEQAKRAIQELMIQKNYAQTLKEQQEIKAQIQNLKNIISELEWCYNEIERRKKRFKGKMKWKKLLEKTQGFNPEYTVVIQMDRAEFFVTDIIQKDDEHTLIITVLPLL